MWNEVEDLPYVQELAIPNDLPIEHQLFLSFLLASAAS